MKYIQHQNFQKLLSVIQKICFYYLYKDDESFDDAYFSFKNENLYYTNVIEIYRKGKKEAEYISLLKAPKGNISTDFNHLNTTIYYKNERYSKAFHHQKIKPDFNEMYQNFIRYLFDNNHDNLQKIIAKDEKFLDNLENFENKSYIEKIQVLLNNEVKETMSDEENLDNPLHQKPFSINSQLKMILHEYMSPNHVETEKIPFKSEKTEKIFFLLYHGLFIEEDKLKKIFTKCFKYYSFGDNDILTSRLRGKVYFAHPAIFNDPFDVNCFLDPKTRIIDKDSSSRDLFRIFCSTDNYNNLLMWAHYGYNHTGYCIEYDPDSIIFNMRAEMRRQGYYLIIVGNVIYSKTREKLKPAKNYFPIYNLSKWIKAAFYKDSIWQYENEFRFVIIDFNNFKKQPPLTKNDGVIINGNIKNIYLGVHIDSVKKSTLVQNFPQNQKIHELKLSDDTYEVKL